MRALLDNVLSIAVAAGREILEVYQNPFEVEYKEDGSFLTAADQRAHDLILAELGRLTPDIPVLSEESNPEIFQVRRQWNRFWLVDPLDGTREFVKRRGNFTVNIALIDNGSSILGVVHTPVKNISHYAALGIGAFRSDEESGINAIRTRTMGTGKTTMMTSHSHSGAQTGQFLQNLESQVGEVDLVSMGSSLKICLVAEGSADIYPRLGPTSEWDTAAAHCVLDVAGGGMIDLHGNCLRYNKPDILNPWFLACGDKSVDWAKYLKKS